LNKIVFTPIFFACKALFHKICQKSADGVVFTRFSVFFPAFPVPPPGNLENLDSRLRVDGAGVVVE
jgi:hypothetical protein